MSNDRKYVGARYVPLIMGEWDNSNTYEPLSIVLHEGNSYTSRQFVPAGIDIDNTAFWALTGNYNAQIEQYRQEVLGYVAKVDACVFNYETVLDMKAAENIKSGYVCHTSGFNSANDGGAAWYIISTSGTANEMDIIACDNGLIANLIEMDTIANALQYGADNTGQNDISGIFNYITSKKPVYLPIGIYKVSQTLEPIFSVFGESYSRQPSTDNATMLMSELSNGVVIDVNADNDIQLRDFCIRCNGNEDGIHYTIDGPRSKITQDKVAIFNLKGIGVKTIPTDDFASRGIFISNFTVFGNSAYPESRGIFLDVKTGDNRLENIEIMGTKYGIRFGSGIYYCNNVHIWNGCLAGSDNGSWWTGTRAIDLAFGPQVFFDNLYLDTTHMMFYNNHVDGYDKTLVNVDNFIYYEDGSNNNVVTADGTLLYSSGGSPVIVLDKAYLYTDGNSKNKNFFNINVKINNPEIHSTLPFTPANLNALFVGNGLSNPKYRISGNTSPNNSTYIELARIRLSAAGFCKMLISNDVGSNLKITELQCVYRNDTNTATFTKTAINGNDNFYYKIENNILHIYLAWGAVSGFQVRAFQMLESTLGIVAFDYGLAGKQNIAYDVLNSDDGLTRIV